MHSFQARWCFISPFEGCETISFRKKCGNTGLTWKQPRLKPNRESLENTQKQGSRKETF